MKIYVLFDKKKSEYIDSHWSSKGGAKAYVTNLGLCADDILDKKNKYRLLDPEDLCKDVVKHIKENNINYFRIKYIHQTRYECREIDIAQAPYEVV